MDVGEAAEGQTILKLIKGQRSLGVILKRTASHEGFLAEKWYNPTLVCGERPFHPWVMSEREC